MPGRGFEPDSNARRRTGGRRKNFSPVPKPSGPPAARCPPSRRGPQSAGLSRSPLYSITLSVSAGSCGGSSSPSNFAVVRLCPRPHPAKPQAGQRGRRHQGPAGEWRLRPHGRGRGEVARRQSGAATPRSDRHLPPAQCDHRDRRWGIAQCPTGPRGSCVLRTCRLHGAFAREHRAAWRLSSPCRTRRSRRAPGGSAWPWAPHRCARWAGAGVLRQHMADDRLSSRTCCAYRS
jgi:hypothetical protein